jgi:hypothetical protein
MSVDKPGSLVERRETVLDVPRRLTTKDDMLEGNR